MYVVCGVAAAGAVESVLALVLVCACVCGPGGRAWRVVVARRGCDVARRCRPHVVVRARQFGGTALHFAAGSGHVAVVSALLSAGADPTVRDLVGDGAADAVVLGVQRVWLASLTERLLWQQLELCAAGELSGWARMCMTLLLRT